MYFSLADIPDRLRETSGPLLLLITAMSLIGILMMVSVGGGDFRTYALPQLIRLAISFGLMLFIALLPMHLLLRYAYAFYALGLIALIVTDVIGHTGMGAQRWLKIGGMNLQPSELMKIAVILALARYYHMLALDDIRRWYSLIPPVLMLVVPAVLILRQPNLGTTVITLGVGACVMFLAGVQWRYFISVAIAAAAAAPVAWSLLHDYQRQRVLTFLEPSEDPLGAGYNIMQSMIGVGSGGFMGKGYLNGSQSQLNFIPEKHTDFIFTVLAEEWGFLGGMVMLGMFAALLMASMRIATSSRSTFGGLLAGGVAAMIFLHVFINIAMVMGMLPVVGLPLPFLSYGGSIMLSTLLGCGLLLNANRHRNRQVGVSRDFA